VGSPSLIRHGNEWWLHTCVEKKFKSPATIEEQVTTNAETRICAVDLNLNEQLRRAGREEKSSGVALSQDAKRKSRPSTDLARHGVGNGHGTAQEGTLGMDERPSSILHPLRLPFE
jgi:hypothetical protein